MIKIENLTVCVDLRVLAYMYNSSKKTIWIGELRTARGTSVVIHDNQLPEATPGRVYLYNAQRNAIVEYVEDIVKPNLHDIDEAATQSAEKEYSSAWKICRAEFMNKHQALLELEKSQDSKVSKKSKTVTEPESDDDNDDSFNADFDDDWSDDFDD